MNLKNKLRQVKISVFMEKNPCPSTRPTQNVRKAEGMMCTEVLTLLLTPVITGLGLCPCCSDTRSCPAVKDWRQDLCMVHSDGSKCSEQFFGKKVRREIRAYAGGGVAGPLKCMHICHTCLLFYVNE